MGSRFFNETERRSQTRAEMTGPHWLATADRLRAVRQACWIFLDRWAADSVAAKARAVRRMEKDLAAADAGRADMDRHDWSVLYRGSVLDD